jgi:hypothetical protein
MVTQLALCHVGSHLLLFISACIWRAQFGAPRCRSLLLKQQLICPWTPRWWAALRFRISPRPALMYSTRQSNGVSNFFAFFSFLSLQSHTQPWPTKFLLQHFLSTTQNLIRHQTLQLLVTRFFSPTDRLSVSEPTTLGPTHKKKWQMALSISTWTLSVGEKLTYSLWTFIRISTDSYGYKTVRGWCSEFFRCCAVKIV